MASVEESDNPPMTHSAAESSLADPLESFEELGGGGATNVIEEKDD